MSATHGNGVQTAQPPQAKGLGSASHRFGPPVDCRRILVVGAGGFGREVLQWARDAWPDHAARIAGFFPADKHIRDRFGAGPRDVSPIRAASPYVSSTIVYGPSRFPGRFAPHSAVVNG